MSGRESVQVAETDYDEGDFNQCPHEMIRATCPGCKCPCSGCDQWRERDAAAQPCPPYTLPSREAVNGACQTCGTNHSAEMPGKVTAHIPTSPSNPSDECYTPRWVFDAMGLTFDLDAAAPRGGPWHVPMRRYYTEDDDGLAKPWEGLVWCNPPFSKFRPWVEKWADHPTGVLMGTYAPERYATVNQLGAADAVAFISVKFEKPDGTLIKPRHGVAVAFRGVGVEPAERLAAADRFGAVMYGRRVA